MRPHAHPAHLPARMLLALPFLRALALCRSGGACSFCSACAVSSAGFPCSGLFLVPVPVQLPRKVAQEHFLGRYSCISLVLAAEPYSASSMLFSLSLLRSSLRDLVSLSLPSRIRAPPCVKISVHNVCFAGRNPSAQPLWLSFIPSPFFRLDEVTLGS